MVNRRARSSSERAHTPGPEPASAQDRAVRRVLVVIKDTREMGTAVESALSRCDDPDRAHLTVFVLVPRVPLMAALAGEDPGRLIDDARRHCAEQVRRTVESLPRTISVLTIVSVDRHAQRLARLLADHHFDAFVFQRSRSWTRRLKRAVAAMPPLSPRAASALTDG